MKAGEGFPSARPSGWPLRAFSCVLHLDVESADMVREGIRELVRGRTAILVSHTADTLGVMDRLVVLEDGQVGGAV